MSSGPLRSFNPTRVRLKLLDALIGADSPERLQPHEGSSETVVLGGALGLVARFNPTRVRLKRLDDVRDALVELASTPRGFV